MKSTFLRATMTFAAFILCLLLPSCVNDDYEMSDEKLDWEITVFQDGVVLPLGSSAKIKMGDILDLLDPETAGYFKEDASGAYSLSITGGNEYSENLDIINNVSDMGAIPIEESFTFSFLNTGGHLSGSVEIKEQKVAIDREFAFEGMEMDVIPKELVSVESIEFDDVYLYMTIRIPQLAELVSESDVSVDMKMNLPSIVRLEDERMVDGALAVSGTLNANGEVTLEPVKVTGMDLSDVDIKADNPFKGMKVTLVGDILFEGGTFNLGNYNTVSPSLQVDGKIMTAGTNDRVRFKKITGKIDYQIYPMTIIMDMSELMSSLNSETLTTSLDLNRLSLKLDVESNFKIPVDAEISIASFKGDVAGRTIACNPVRLDCPEVSGESVLTRLWLSNTSVGKPEGYRFVDVDLVSMLKDMPDRIEFTIDAATDSKENSELVPSVKYILKADYEIGLPIEFGEDFGIQFSERIDDIPQEVGVFLEGGSLALAGQITNSLPLQLEMKVSLLDSKGKSIQFADDAGYQVIKSCGADGTPGKSDISLMLKAKPGEDLSDIASLELDFKATAKGAAGVPVTKDSFMHVTLYARVPEGITVDLNRYVEIEDDDE